MIALRPMHLADLPAVAAIHAANTGETGSTPWRARVEELLEGPAVTLVACDPTGTVVGYLAGEVRTWEVGSAPAGWITGVDVHPDHARQGIARSLLAAGVRALVDRGAQAVRTMVRRDDVPVLRFFRDAGFVQGPYSELELPMGGDR